MELAAENVRSASRQPSRRDILRLAALAAVTAGGGSVLRSPAASGSTEVPVPEPRPIPGGLSPLPGTVPGSAHVWPPSYLVPGEPSSGVYEQSSVFDFAGGIASTYLYGPGQVSYDDGLTWTDARFEADMRVMKGQYLPLAGGPPRQAAFAFV